MPDATPSGLTIDTTKVPGIGTGGGRRGLLVTTILAIVLGLLLGAVLIVISEVMSGRGFDLAVPFKAYQALIEGSLKDARAIGSTLNIATPLILSGLAVTFGFRAGLFNIGGNGQFLMGAFFAAIVGAAPIFQGPLHMVLAILAGLLGGMLWGFIPGILKAWRGAHEVVTTIMLNYVAYLLLNELASRVFRDPTATFAKTRDVTADAQLPILIEGTRLHAGILVALLTAFLVWFLLFKTALGFEIRTVGINAFAARYAGMKAAFIAVLTMSLSGGLAGLGGAVENLGVTKGYPAEYIVNYGFDGIAVALLGRSHPFGVVGAAVLFGALRAGAGSMQRATGIPIDIITIVQAFIILFVAAEPVLRRAVPWLRSRRTPAASAAGA
ncbi:MAG: ral nucleoside transport system permease protein [Chloroflexota bacterium]|jgi:simple sugar transport system permease protein|nr:ral nucleoside transport system permease protein [Chloroflexota bacterium]